MKLKGILSIAGQSGLFKIIAQTRGGFVVESVTDKKRMPVSSTQRISMLEDISVYTKDEDVSLSEVMKALGDKKGLEKDFDVKADPAKLRSEFAECFPAFDDERVYNSDIKKILTWFNLLRSTDAFEEEEKTEEVKEEKAAAPKKKTTPGKSVAKKNTDVKPMKKPASNQKKTSASKKST